jgi:hypothetical protein
MVLLKTHNGFSKKKLSSLRNYQKILNNFNDKLSILHEKLELEIETKIHRLGFKDLTNKYVSFYLTYILLYTHYVYMLRFACMRG